MTSLPAGQLGRNVGHTVLHQHIPTNDSIDIKTHYTTKAGIATTEMICRIVRVTNALLQHGQKALALFLTTATPLNLHRLKDTIFHKHRHCTVEAAISTVARKRLAKLGKVNNSTSGSSSNINSTGSLATIETISEQGEEQEQGEEHEQGNPEEEANESGTKGDHGGFFGSLLMYLHTPTATIKYNNKHITLIRPIWQQYTQACPLDVADFRILDHGLESSIMQTLGVSLAVQVRRYFIDNATGLSASLPHSPAIGNESSSQFLMDQHPNEDRVVINPKPGQPTNLLPSYLLHGMIVTNGRSLHLSAIDLQLHKGKHFMSDVIINPDDGMVYRCHVLAPDPYHHLPSVATAIPDQAALSRFFPDISKVDVSAIDLGKEFMAAFACRRYDRADFIYTVHAKTKAAYQPTIKAVKELERCLDNGTITHVGGNESAIAVYQSALPSLSSDPMHRVLIEQTDEYRQYAAFYNNHGRQQKHQEQAK
ncbi:hypothetical protein BGZ74_002261 [Mortierella antarctica]|nr:hypothetical protein BGZ74_002261 [Mortierella antarctica]